MSRKFHTSQTITIAGDSCGTEVNLKMSVAFTVHPGCKQTLTEPGEEPSVEIDDIAFFESNREVLLPSLVDSFGSDRGFKDWLMAEASEQHEAALDDAADCHREQRNLALIAYSALGVPGED